MTGNAAPEELTEELKKALDETRRVLYMALLAPEAGRHAATAGTLVNALLHHAAPGLDLSAQGFHEVATRVVATVTGRESAWALDLVSDITNTLSGDGKE